MRWKVSARYHVDHTQCAIGRRHQKLTILTCCTLLLGDFVRVCLRKGFALDRRCARNVQKDYILDIEIDRSGMKWRGRIEGLRQPSPKCALCCAASPLGDFEEGVDAKKFPYSWAVNLSFPLRFQRIKARFEGIEAAGLRL